MAKAVIYALCLAALAVQLSSYVQIADAHAVMLDPPSRQWQDYLLRYNYNPHAVNGGGKDMVSSKFTLRWPKRNLGSICGDPAGEGKWDKPGPVMKTYTPGSTISVDVLFAQNHLGRMFLRVCPLSAKSDADCRQLQRADGSGPGFDLPLTKDWYGVTSGYVPPLEPPKGFSMYTLKPIGKSEGCAAWACDQFKGMYVYSATWKLPAGFTCQHCKLQMEYLTGSSCWPPCTGGNCKKPVPYAYCDAPEAEPQNNYPEEFWNCADISIGGGAVTGRKLLK